MNVLTLQIKKDSFQSILKGEQDIEHRYVYPSNVTRYVYFEHDGKRYKRQEDIPNDDKDVDVVPIKYDALVLINGRRKDAPLYTVNNAFSVIKVENYADKEPIVVEGMLRSGKDDGNSHGIGIKSINNSLSKYDGKMSWSYDKAKGMFRTVISINNSQINI